MLKEENGVVIGQINVRELATEVGKKVYVKKATDDMIIANSSMAMNGMNMDVVLTEQAEIYDVAPNAENQGAILQISHLLVAPEEQIGKGILAAVAFGKIKVGMDPLPIPGSHR